MMGSSFNSVKSQLASSAWDAIALPATPLFGTDGIRGRVGEILNAQLALQLGFWAGQVLQSHTSVAPVILGQDSRNSSDMLAMALLAGLTAAGLDVWHLGLCPTGMVAYLTNTSEAIAGVMISASHNPPEDNGIKFFGSDGSKLADAVQAQIETALRGNWQLVEGKRWGRQYYRPDLSKQYLEFLQAPLQEQVNLAGTRIVLDLAWGAVVNLAATAFRALGAEVICLHDRADGDRINVDCGSTHLAPLQAAVLEHQADMGFAFDGDADRVMAVDNRGRLVDGDYILYFWGQALRQKQQLPGNIIVSTVMANLGFERAWEHQGGRLVRTSVGDRHVYEEMIRQGAMLGGEQSGHILCRHYSVSGDGLLSALHLAALVQQASTSLSKLVDRSFQTYPQLLRNVRVEDRDRRLGWQNCEQVQQAIAQAQADLSDRGRILVRASGTEPLIRVMVEAVSHDLANYWVEKLVAIIEEHLIGNT